MCKQHEGNRRCSQLKRGGTPFFCYRANYSLHAEGPFSCVQLAAEEEGREEQRKERWGETPQRTVYAQAASFILVRSLLIIHHIIFLGQIPLSLRFL